MGFVLKYSPGLSHDSLTNYDLKRAEKLLQNFPNTDTLILFCDFHIIYFETLKANVKM